MVKLSSSGCDKRRGLVCTTDSFSIGGSTPGSSLRKQCLAWFVSVSTGLCVCVGCSSVFADNTPQDDASASKTLDNKRLFFTPKERDVPRDVVAPKPDPVATILPESSEAGLVAAEDRSPKAASISPRAPSKPELGIHYQARFQVGDAVYFIINNIPCKPFFVNTENEGSLSRSVLCQVSELAGHQFTVGSDARSLNIINNSATLGTLVPGQSL